MPVTAPSELLVCEDCDAVHERPRLARRDVARCRRCGAVLARGAMLTLDGHLALAVGAAIVFAIASASPIVTLELRGVQSEASLFEALRWTWNAGEYVVALLALATTFAFPLVMIGLRLVLLLPLSKGQVPAHAALLLRALRVVMRWSMVEVFMLGILIAVVRSAGITDLVLGPGLFAYAVLTALLTGMQAASLQPMWQRLRWGVA